MAKQAKLTTSRKGKKAWRKNVDVTDIEEGLEQARDRKRHLGDDADIEVGDFVIDTTPVPVTLVKKPKYQEIVANRSKVAALAHPHASAAKARPKKNLDGVLKTQLLHLIKMNGGKYKSEDKVKARIDKDGLTNVDARDLWDAPEPESDVPKVLTELPLAPITKPKHAPKSFKRAPVTLDKVEDNSAIHGGKSYNPTLELWKELINLEYTTEAQKESIRQELNDFKDKLAQLAAELNNHDELLSEEEDDEETNDNDKDDDKYRLSVNAPLKNKKKTKYQRNKQNRHKQRLQLEQEIKELKIKVKELNKIDDILAAKAIEEVKPQSFIGKEKKVKKLFKYTALQAPLEVKLLDELTSNLKNVKPEGNLLYDTMLGLQKLGKVEARLPVAKKRKYAPKVTEKWTYKDFK